MKGRREADLDLPILLADEKSRLVKVGRKDGFPKRTAWTGAFRRPSSSQKRGPLDRPLGSEHNLSAPSTGTES